MADRDSTIRPVPGNASPTPIPSAIQVLECETYVDYTGSKEDLITAGIAAEAMFPVLPKRVRDTWLNQAGTKIYFTREDAIASEGNNKRFVDCSRIKGGRFRLRIPRPCHEIARLRRGSKEQVQTPGEFAVKTSKLLRTHIEIIKALAAGVEVTYNAHGFRLNNEAEILRLAGALAAAVEVSCGTSPRPSNPLTLIQGGKAD